MQFKCKFQSNIFLNGVFTGNLTIYKIVSTCQLKILFFSSMILRDVTYRSAQSFGSFHLIRLLYDEYMCLLVEMRLAKAINQPIIGVMRQTVNFNFNLNNFFYI